MWKRKIMNSGYGLNCVPQNPYVEILTDLRMWLYLEMEVFKGDEVKMRLSGWALLQSDWCPHQRRSGRPAPCKDIGLQRMPALPTPWSQPSASRTGRKCLVAAPGFWFFITAALATSTVADPSWGGFLSKLLQGWNDFPRNLVKVRTLLKRLVSCNKMLSV